MKMVITLDNITVSNNVIRNSGGILFRRYTTNLKIENNQFFNSCSEEAAIYASCPFICSIRGNTMNCAQIGIYPYAAIVIDADTPEAKHVVISDNIIYNFERRGIVTRDAKNLSITNNHLRDIGSLENGAYSAIMLEGVNDKNDGGIISNNVISSGQSNKPGIGIECKDGPSMTSNFMIINNYIKNTVDVAIYSNASAVGMIIRGIPFRFRFDSKINLQYFLKKIFYLIPLQTISTKSEIEVCFPLLFDFKFALNLESMIFCKNFEFQRKIKILSG